MNSKETPWQKLVGQIIFGGKAFVADIESRLGEAKEIGDELGLHYTAISKDPMLCFLSGHDWLLATILAFTKTATDS